MIQSYLCVTKVSKPLGLSVQLKGKLEPGVSVKGRMLKDECGRFCFILRTEF